MSTDKLSKTSKASSTVAKSSDGTIQINFTIPYLLVEEKKKQALEELNKVTVIPGFRKGMAPLTKIEAGVSENIILEKTLSKLLPQLLSETIDKHNLKLAIYPKFSLLKAKKDEDWQIRAETCEIPEVILGDYEKVISGSLRAKEIWTPGASKKDKKPPTREEKEQIVIKTLLETTKLTIPKILIDAEVNTRLSHLLERLEKLGLTLEGYLSSIGKKAEDIRANYEKEVGESIALELILNKLAEEKGIIVENRDIDEITKVSSADHKLKEELETPEKRRVVEAILRRRKALEALTALA